MKIDETIKDENKISRKHEVYANMLMYAFSMKDKRLEIFCVLYRVEVT